MVGNAAAGAGAAPASAATGAGAGPSSGASPGPREVWESLQVDWSAGNERDGDIYLVGGSGTRRLAMRRTAWTDAHGDNRYVYTTEGILERDFFMTQRAADAVDLLVRCLGMGVQEHLEAHQRNQQLLWTLERVAASAAGGEGWQGPASKDMKVRAAGRELARARRRAERGGTHGDAPAQRWRRRMRARNSMRDACAHVRRRAASDKRGRHTPFCVCMHATDSRSAVPPAPVFASGIRNGAHS